MTCSSILVTGASGLLGSNICRLAADAGRRVRGLVRTDGDADIGPMRAMAGATYPTPLVDPKRTNDELGITLTPVRAGVEKTVTWLREQRRI